jgi:adenylate cyclase
MLQLLTSLSSKLFGDPRFFVLEHRLFNTITLLSAVANIGGAFTVMSQQNYQFLLLLNLSTGILFFIFYFLSRFRNAYRLLYWPFILLIVGFLFLNSLQNAGSHGGAHYYFITALVLAVILSGKTRRTILGMLLFVAATITLLVVEYKYPGLIKQYTNNRERFIDVTGNLVFAQIFTGILVQVLTQNLNQERRKSDQLLRNVLPESIALELTQTERVQPVDYESASVLFTDFVGFTQIAENFTPQRLITELDGCFSEFDSIARKHNLEKIKTIGDAYMAVGGIPKANKTHAVDCVLAALEIEELISSLREREMAENRPYWQIRVGVHTGDLVAGVVGSQKFSYDVWGDTVNTASRLESSGEPGRINISSMTQDLVKDFFDCEFRGLVAAKHKGAIEMYFVNGIQAELSVAGNRREPNKEFWQQYEALCC